jgi:hypothetical protein
MDGKKYNPRRQWPSIALNFDFDFLGMKLVVR